MLIIFDYCIINVSSLKKKLCLCTIICSQIKSIIEKLVKKKELLFKKLTYKKY